MIIIKISKATFNIILLLLICSGCNRFWDCKEKGVEYKKFDKRWRIIKYEVNGNDLTDSLHNYVGFKNVNFFTSYEKETCTTRTSGFSASGYFDDSTKQRITSGAWLWTENVSQLKFIVDTDLIDIYVSSINGFNNIYYNTFNVTNKVFMELPFKSNNPWNVLFKADSLICTSSIDNINYKLILK